VCFIKRPSVKKVGEFHNLSRNQPRIWTGLLSGHFDLNVHLLRLEFGNSPEYYRCKQASATASPFHCDCDAVAI
jgi:hypothetical protein